MNPRHSPFQGASHVSQQGGQERAAMKYRTICKILAIIDIAHIALKTAYIIIFGLVDLLIRVDIMNARNVPVGRTIVMWSIFLGVQILLSALNVWVGSKLLSGTDTDFPIEQAAQKAKFWRTYQGCLIVWGFWNILADSGDNCTIISTLFRVAGRKLVSLYVEELETLEA